MTVITTKLVVQADGTTSLVDPIPAGEYVASMVPSDKGRNDVPHPLTHANVPVWDAGSWPAGAVVQPGRNVWR